MYVFHDYIDEFGSLIVQNIVISKHLTIRKPLDDLVGADTIEPQPREANTDLALLNKVHFRYLLFFDQDCVLLRVGCVKEARN